MHENSFEQLGSRVTQALRICSAGAARGLIRSVASHWRGTTGVDLHVEFAAVGAVMQHAREAFGGGLAWDLAVLTPALINRLAQEFPSRVMPSGSLGTTPPAFACAADDTSTYDISTPATLRETLLALDVIFTGDLEKSTVGKHLLSVLDSLGIARNGGPEIVGCAGGSQAVEQLASRHGRRALACAQLSEVLEHPTARVLPSLPPRFAIQTEYALATLGGDCSDAADAFARFLTAAEQDSIREKAGFQPRLPY